MGKVKKTVFPAHDSKEMLANRFCEFFTGKFETIRSELSKSKQVNVSEALKSDIQYVGQKLVDFFEATNKEIYVIMGAPTKSCENDPIPTSLLKPCIEELLPLITVIINKSLSGSSEPTTFKEAIIRPILKKPELDCKELKNYRPVSNLPFISEILENVVSKRLKHHLEMNNLQEPLESAYRACYSTETALLRVHHDILSALDKNSCMALMMLDLSAAFDVIDHTILLRRLRFSFGISGAALEWIESYLTQRTQRIVIGGSASEDLVLRSTTRLSAWTSLSQLKRSFTHQLDFDGSVICKSDCVKNLGVFFNKSLTMENQISAVSKSCFYHLRNISRIRPFITEDACKTPIVALVTSRLDYGNALLYGITETNISRLQRVQNTAARIVTRTKKHDHISEVLISLHWLPVKFGTYYKILLYTFKVLQGTSPSYLKELITVDKPSRTLRSYDSKQLVKPRVRTKTYGTRRFDHAAATSWNGLPDALRFQTSLLAFKRDLKTHLFKIAYDV
ncbi:uncharacterized protein LOC134246046 [Saccostrea cucullata]|uniref:uncharacterized protein LOC134246046 n=1 Tax=Saccostrea cuccullata TaxID=36930 RepID=UPI002ED590C0